MAEVEVPNVEELGLHLHPLRLPSDLLFCYSGSFPGNPLFTQWLPADPPNSFLPLNLCNFCGQLTKSRQLIEWDYTFYIIGHERLATRE